MSDEFDFDKALKALQSGTAITGKGGALTPLIKKHQTSVNDEIEAKILSMYGLGMSYRDIAARVEDALNNLAGFAGNGGGLDDYQVLNCEWAL